MRFRFSLRVLFIFTAFFAGSCYYRIVMPGVTAKQFIDSIGAEDYPSADNLFLIPEDRVLAQWNDKYWGFRSQAELLPWDFSQFVGGRKTVRLHVTYFFLDEYHDTEMQIAATASGMRSPGKSFSNNSMIIDCVLLGVEKR